MNRYPNSNYPNQNQYPQQPQQQHSRIPMNPGVALLGMMGQRTIQQNQQSYGNYGYQMPHQ